MSAKIERIYVKPEDSRNGNILLQYDIERNGTAWVWSGENGRNQMLEFKNEFYLEKDLETTLHLSADNRFEAYLDEEFFGAGPDRCDLKHWSFGSYKMQIPAGKHVLRVLCWNFEGGRVPWAQLTFRPGFILGCSEPDCADIFNTGRASWFFRELKGITFDPAYSIITHTPVFDASQFFHPEEFKPVQIVAGPWKSSGGGGKHGGWILHPSDMPEQLRIPRELKGGKVRAFFRDSSGFRVNITEEHINAPEVAEWQMMLDSGKCIEVAPGQNFAVLIDMENYYCGYSTATLSGGDKDSSLRILWAEAAAYITENSRYSSWGCQDPKGNRSELPGKQIPAPAQADEYGTLDGEKHDFRSLWWRAGRYILLHIRSGKAGFTIHNIGFTESRYPLEHEAQFGCSDERLRKIIPMMVRAMQMCAHETYMDCPYCEQLMYVGDTRLECLATFIMTQDARLPKRALELFDWSRSEWEGLAAEHYPSTTPQLSSTFSMIWVYMLKDYVMYRRLPDSAFRKLRNSVRAMLASLAEYLNDSDLLENLPGWSFVDWVNTDSWSNGVPVWDNTPGSICSLFYLGALKTAMELEDILPESAGCRIYFGDLYDRVRRSVLKNFYIPEKHLFADDLAKQHFSRHAQCLALLYDVLPEEERLACYQETVNNSSLAEPTVYFSFYLLETFQKFGGAGMIPDRLNIWLDQLAGGAVTTWERPEPSRSDCHAWGAHPLYHFYSSIAGIRPAAPGFRKVRIAPQLGALTRVNGKMPHPDGWIAFGFRKENGVFCAEITLPEGLDGEFVLGDCTQSLKSGKNSIIIM